jgi:hypothetical protein
MMLRNLIPALAISCIAVGSINAANDFFDDLSSSTLQTSPVEQLSTAQALIDDNTEAYQSSGIHSSNRQQNFNAENPDNPFSDPDYFESSYEDSSKTLFFKTKKLCITLNGQGATINGEFHQWRVREKSWGIFNSDETISIEHNQDVYNDEPGYEVTIKWARRVPPRFKDTVLKISKSMMSSTEDLEWSLIDPSGNVEQEMIQLNSADKLNSLVSFLNPYFEEPYTKELFIPENATYKERLMQRLLTTSSETHSQSSHDEILVKGFMNHYTIGFTYDEVLQLSKATYQSFNHDEILMSAAKAYLYVYSDDEIRQLSSSVHSTSIRDEILKLLAFKDENGSGVSNIAEHTSQSHSTNYNAVRDLIRLSRGEGPESEKTEIIMNGINRLKYTTVLSAVELCTLADSVSGSKNHDNILMTGMKAYADFYDYNEAEKIIENAVSYKTERKLRNIYAGGGTAKIEENRFYTGNNGPTIHIEGTQGSNVTIETETSHTQTTSIKLDNE